MALLESIKIPLGTKIPEFQLSDPMGKSYKAADLFGERGLLIVFTCNHCPYALAVWPRVVRLANYAKGMRVGTVAINPNINPDFPDDAGNLRQLAARRALAVPQVSTVFADGEIGEGPLRTISGPGSRRPRPRSCCAAGSILRIGVRAAWPRPTRESSPDEPTSAGRRGRWSAAFAGPRRSR